MQTRYKAMQDNCENNENVKNQEKDDQNPDSSNEQSHDEFNARVIKQTVTSVTIAWNLIPQTEVYKIERHQKTRGWEKVAWTSESPATIQHLEDNFAYKFRIKALIISPDLQEYVDFKVSQEFVASTLAALPSTIGLYRAIRKGQQFLVKRILRRSPDLIEYPGPNGYLPLANAIAFGEICIVDVLLSSGASVHIGNLQNGRTPLHLAFYHGRLPVARMLLNKKADLEASDANGMTAAHFAIDANQCEILRFALEGGANLEARDACGWTLLLRAVVMSSDVAILKLLIMHGANTKVLDRLGLSCVDLARLYHNEPATMYFENFFGRNEALKPTDERLEEGEKNK